MVVQPRVLCNIGAPTTPTSFTEQLRPALRTSPASKRAPRLTLQAQTQHSGNAGAERTHLQVSHLSGARQSPWVLLTALLVREFTIAEALMRDNLKYIAKGVLLAATLGAKRVFLEGLSPRVVPLMLREQLDTVLWYSLLWYTFDLINQSSSPQQITEDARNKPYRPLAAGILDIHGARVRLALGVAALAAFSAAHGFLPVVPFYLLSMALHYYFGLDRCWWTKNLCNGLFVLAIEIPPTLLLSGFSNPGASLNGIFALALAWSLASSIQDFRDVEGDAEVGRKSMPMVLGDQKARWLTALLLFSATAIMCAARIVTAGSMGVFLLPNWAYATVCIAGTAAVALRLITKRRPEDEQDTYCRMYLVGLFWGFGLFL